MQIWILLNEYVIMYEKLPLHQSYLNLGSKNKTAVYIENFFTIKYNNNIEIKPKNIFTFLAAAAAANLATPEPFFF